MYDATVVNELAASLHVDQALHPRENDMVRASSIGSCRRQLAYRVLWYREGRPEPPMWSHLLAIFDLGHALHLQLQQRLSNQGSLAWVDADLCLEDGHPHWKGNCEIDLKDEEDWVAGHCDGLTRPLRRRKVKVSADKRDGESSGEVTGELELLEPTEPEDPAGKRYILDIKTCTARDRVEAQYCPETGQLSGVRERPSTYARLKKPKDEHIAQTNIYAHLTTRPSFRTDRLSVPLATPPDIMVIYVAKDLAPDWYAARPLDYPEPRGLLNAPYKVYTQAANPRLIQALLKKVATVREHVERGALPPRDYHHHPEQPAWPCVDCPFRATCYAAEGYFAGEDRPVLPPLLAHRLGGLDPSQKRLG